MEFELSGDRSATINEDITVAGADSTTKDPNITASKSPMVGSARPVAAGWTDWGLASVTPFDYHAND